MALRRNAPEYEDFQPSYEWSPEREAYILYIYLPGFSRERLEIMYMHSRRIISVAGEKPVGYNKYRRFNQTFPVPDNCDVLNIRAKFQHGTLTITLPKANIPPPSPPRQEVKPFPREPARSPPMQELARRSPPREKVPEEPPKAPKQEMKPPAQEAARSPPKAKVPDEAAKPQKAQEAIPSKATLPEAVKEKGDKEAIASPKKPEMATAEKFQRDKAPETPERSDLVTDRKKKEMTQAIGKPTEPKKPAEKGTEKTQFKENEVSKKGKESVMENAVQKISEKEKSDKPSGVEQGKSKTDDFFGNKMNEIRSFSAGSRQAVKDLARRLNYEDENRKLMINVGAAALVLMGLGAYISYNFATSGKDKN